MGNAPSKQIVMHIDTLKDLLASGRYSDLTITCGSDTHRVHKAIVCARCGFFERAERFAVGKEAAEGTIVLPKDEPAIIRLLLEYLYTSEYTPNLPTIEEIEAKEAGWRSFVPKICRPQCEKEYPAPPKGGSSQLLVHSKLYAIGEKYDVPGLKEMAKNKFYAAGHAFWKTADFMIAAEHAYRSTKDADEGLRKCVKEILAKRKGMLARADVKAFLDKTPGLMYEIMIKVSK